jgi:hypothetical protein
MPGRLTVLLFLALVFSCGCPGDTRAAEFL